MENIEKPAPFRFVFVSRINLLLRLNLRNFYHRINVFHDSRPFKNYYSVFLVLKIL